MLQILCQNVGNISIYGGWAPIYRPTPRSIERSLEVTIATTRGPKGPLYVPTDTSIDLYIPPKITSYAPKIHPKTPKYA